MNIRSSLQDKDMRFSLVLLLISNWGVHGSSIFKLPSDGRFLLYHESHLKKVGIWPSLKFTDNEKFNDAVSM